MTGQAQDAAQPAGSAGSYELVAPLGSVMTIMEDVFNKMPDRAKAGTPKDYKALRREAMFVAEMGNLFGRIKDRSSKKDWIDFTGTLKAAGLAMADSAAKGDGENFKKSFDKAKDSCGKCHDKYRD